MQKTGKVLVVIPAFNEESFIGTAIEKVRKTGARTEIIVVSDGSTDRTADIARKQGCIVIKLPKRLGKSSAFFAGIKEALKRGADAVVTIDADTTFLPKTTMKKLAADALHATGKKEAKMFVAPISERLDKTVCSDLFALYFSGARSFSRQALWKLKQSKMKSASKGFGLEHFQTELFKKNAIPIKAAAVRQAPAYRAGKGSAIKQDRDIKATIRQMKKFRKHRRR